MNIFKQLKANIINILANLAIQRNFTINPRLFDKIIISPVIKVGNGELYTNAAFIFAQKMDYSIKELASLVANELKHTNSVQAIEVTEKGYINMTLRSSIWQELLCYILTQGENYGQSPTKNNILSKFIIQPPTHALNVNIEKMQEHSKNNTIFYIQYISIWANYILNHAKLYLPEAYIHLEQLEFFSFKKLPSKHELILIKWLAMWPELLEEIEVSLEGYRIISYLKSLANNFYYLWYDGKINKDLRFLCNNDIDLTVCRLALVKAVAIVVSSAISIMGINTIEDV